MRIPRKHKIIITIGKYFITIVLSIWGIIAIFPLFYTFINSFKTRLGYAEDRFWFSVKPTIENFIEVFNRFNYGKLFLNSVITTLGGVLLATIVSFLAAYALTKLSFRGSNLIFILIVATLMVPIQTIMYPLFQTANDMHLVGKNLGLIIAYSTFGLTLWTYLISAYLRSIPNDLIEAALIDGASHFQIMKNVMIPISKPAIITLSIINTVWMWNDLLLPLLIFSQGNQTTLMVAVAIIRTQYDVHVPLISAGLMVGMVPVLIAYFLGQRQLVKGLTAGAIKM